jgi:hypothetical protein
MSKNMKSHLFKAAVLGALSVSPAFALTISSGNPGGSFDNVLVGNALVSATIQGHFNGQPTYFVDFTSTSGNGLLATSGNGQASVIGTAGNDPITQLSFFLENNATFKEAVINPDAPMDGLINFTIDYLDPNAQQHNQQFSLDGNGQNFFDISAAAGEVITKVSFTSAVGISDLGQVRMTGFEAGRPPVTTPEGGTTIVLAGASFVALAGLRSKLIK